MVSRHQADRDSIFYKSGEFQKQSDGSTVCSEGSPRQTRSPGSDDAKANRQVFLFFCLSNKDLIWGSTRFRARPSAFFILLIPSRFFSSSHYSWCHTCLVFMRLLESKVVSVFLVSALYHYYNITYNIWVSFLGESFFCSVANSSVRNVAIGCPKTR